MNRTGLIALTLFVTVSAPGGELASGLKATWTSSPPIITVGTGKNASDPHVSIKDPSLVFHDGAWHLFATVRMKSGKVDIEYIRFADWGKAETSERHILALHDNYYCAPQVFFCGPHSKWYLIYQLADEKRTPPFGPCFSTTTNIADPESWSKPAPMVTNAPPKPKWLDFWVISDSNHVFLFYTSLDGQMWRRQTSRASFPFGWSEQVLALQGDIFEASHTYKLRGRGEFLTIVEAQRPGRRYYKAYLAERLDGPWVPLSDTWEKPFAGYNNVAQQTEWTTSISHGELLRTSVDEFMEVDPTNLRLLFQGVDDPGYKGNYGQIPWKLGLLQSAPEANPLAKP
jgi:hypothetical protein